MNPWAHPSLAKREKLTGKFVAQQKNEHLIMFNCPLRII